MSHTTSDVPTGLVDTTPAVSAVDRWNILKDALGVATQEEVADRTGIDLRTLQRMVERPERSLIRNALAVRAATGVGLDELFPDAPAVPMAEAA